MDLSTRRAESGDVLHAIETASLDELRALQLERLKWSLHHAYENSGFYRRQFEAHGVHPGDFKHLDDLARFPFTTKADLRDTYPFGMFAVPRERVARVHASSGTTGKPTVVGYTLNDIDTWSEAVARSIFAAGGRPGDRVHVAYGYGLFTGGLGAHYGAERLGCTVIPMSGGQTAKQALLIQDLEPDIIMMTPSYALNVADELAAQGADSSKLALRCGIFGAEPWTESLRAEIEERLQIDALDIYGLSEVIGPGVAQECIETKDGPTIWEDWFYPEVIDPETGESLDDGEQGELVFTSLTKEALPVIRYRTRDLTRLLPGSARPMRRMARITGRSDDMLIIRGVNVFPTQVEEVILAVDELAPHYQLEVTRKGHLDAIAVQVELRPEYANIERDAIAARTRARIKSVISISCEVRVGPPGTVPRSQGKAQRVVDSREK
jgi:phenylacetate-CoA ligase